MRCTSAPCSFSMYFAHLWSQKCLAQNTQICDLEVSSVVNKACKTTVIDMSVLREAHFFCSRGWRRWRYSRAGTNTGPVMICTWKNTHLNTHMRSSHPLCPASGSCSVKSGFFLLSMETFSQPVKSLLLGAGPHPGPLRLHGCLAAFKRICYARTIVPPLKTLLLFGSFFLPVRFPSRQKAIYCHLYVGRRKKS